MDHQSPSTNVCQGTWSLCTERDINEEAKYNNYLKTLYGQTFHFNHDELNLNFDIYISWASRTVPKFRFQRNYYEIQILIVLIGS